MRIASNALRATACIRRYTRDPFLPLHPKNQALRAEFPAGTKGRTGRFQFQGEIPLGHDSTAQFLRGTALRVPNEGLARRRSQFQGETHRHHFETSKTDPAPHL